MIEQRHDLRNNRSFAAPKRPRWSSWISTSRRQVRHNFLGTTDSMCLSNDVIEATIHYMLLFPEYAIHRTVLLGKITTPIYASYGVDCSMLNDQELLALLLYGNDAFNETSNKCILLATIFYVNSANRYI